MKNDVKLVVRKKKTAASKRKLAPALSKRGLPSLGLNVNVGDATAATPPEAPSYTDEDFFEPSFDDPDADEIPCDSLLALRSLVQAKRCLYIPLHVGMIPCVLESQVYSTLKSEDGSDSVATTELHDLISSKKLRQLLSHNALDGIEVLLESHHYYQAVWDAHRHSQVSCPKVTAWFLSTVKSLTGRSLSRDELERAWNINADTINMNSNISNSSFSEALDKLVQMQVLLPTKSDQSYLLWLPHWGTVLQEMAKAKQRVIGHIKRSHYKEISQTHFERQNFPGMSNKFVIEWMLEQGFVCLHSKPCGTFIRLPHDNSI